MHNKYLLCEVWFNAYSVDTDQTLRDAASDLWLYYLRMSLLWDARLKLVIVSI